MANYLRTINEHFMEGNSFGTMRESEVLRAAVGPLDVPYLCWMFEHYATPVKTTGIGKVNICFTQSSPNPPPEDVLGIAYVIEHFDAALYQSLAGRERPLYHLDRLHAAVARCAQHFGWEKQSVDAAYSRIKEADFYFAFAWKKPVASADRRLKVQVVAEVTDATRLFLIFTDRETRELRRVLLSKLGFGPLESVLGRIGWQDRETVRVQLGNNRDYWLCTVDGSPEFHYPPAAAGNPQGVFALGRLYYEGTYVLQDPPRGLALIEEAAAKGDKHAQNYLRRVSQGTGT
jgi:hypothetical protein